MLFFAASNRDCNKPTSIVTPWLLLKTLVPFNRFIFLLSLFFNYPTEPFFSFIPLVIYFILCYLSFVLPMSLFWFQTNSCFFTKQLFSPGCDLISWDPHFLNSVPHAFSYSINSVNTHSQILRYISNCLSPLFTFMNYDKRWKETCGDEKGKKSTCEIVTLVYDKTLCQKWRREKERCVVDCTNYMRVNTLVQ